MSQNDSEQSGQVLFADIQGLRARPNPYHTVKPVDGSPVVFHIEMTIGLPTEVTDENREAMIRHIGSVIVNNLMPKKQE